MPVIWSGMMNPSARTQAEMTKMVVEKQMAFAEACVAVNLELFRMMFAPWTPQSADRTDAGGDRAGGKAREGQCPPLAALVSSPHSFRHDARNAFAHRISSTASGPPRQCGDLP